MVRPINNNQFQAHVQRVEQARDKSDILRQQVRDILPSIEEELLLSNCYIFQNEQQEYLIATASNCQLTYLAIQQRFAKEHRNSLLYAITAKTYLYIFEDERIYPRYALFLKEAISLKGPRSRSQDTAARDVSIALYKHNNFVTIRINQRPNCATVTT